MDYDTLELGRDRPMNPPSLEDMIDIDIDEEKFLKAQRFFEENLLGIIVGYVYGLLLLFTLAESPKSLLFTGQSDGAKKSFKRYMDTFGHLYRWHTRVSPSNMAQSEGMRSILAVVKMHRYVKHSMETSNFQRIFNQYDMGVTQAGFVGPVVVYARMLGFSGSNDELEAFVYYWNLLGYWLGVEQEYNVCAHGLSNCQNVWREIEQRTLIPGITNPTPRYVKLSTDFEGGTRLANPLFYNNSLFAYLFPKMGLPKPPLTVAEYLCSVVLAVLFNMCFYIPAFKWVLNKLLRMQIYYLCSL